MSKKLFVKTYGCQMNVYDSARMADVLAPLGYVVTDRAEDADLIILNTCHIRDKAGEKVYSELGRLRARHRGTGKTGTGRALVAVTGCVAQAEGEGMLDRAPDIDIIVGPQSYHHLPEMVARAERAAAQARTRDPQARTGDPQGTSETGGPRTGRDVKAPPNGDKTGNPIPFGGPPNGHKTCAMDITFPAQPKFDYLPLPGPRGASAFLSVQEGCDKFCTFCVVPYTRGAEYSRPGADIIAEARHLVKQGSREIVLLGQNVNAYHGAGPDGRDWSLGRLIRAMADIEGLERMRYTTSHPADMDDDLIAAHAEVDILMPFLHLPVQSGSDRILRLMNRRYQVKAYRRIIDRLRQARPDIALSSDFIVGFPGETEIDFAATLALSEEIGFAQAYSFIYSPRPGTPAATMAHHVEKDVANERLARLQNQLNHQQKAFNQRFVGQDVAVLFERKGRHLGQICGRSPYMQSVHMEGPDSLIGHTVPVQITAAGSHSLAARYGTPLNDTRYGIA